MKKLLAAAAVAVCCLGAFVPSARADVNVYNNITVCRPQGRWLEVTNWYWMPGHWETYYVTRCVGIVNGRAQYAQVPVSQFYPGYWYPVQEYVWVWY